jgi:hypothetical protein
LGRDSGTPSAVLTTAADSKEPVCALGDEHRGAPARGLGACGFVVVSKRGATQ